MHLGKPPLRPSWKRQREKHTSTEERSFWKAVLMQILTGAGQITVEMFFINWLGFCACDVGVSAATRMMRTSEQNLLSCLFRPCLSLDQWYRFKCQLCAGGTGHRALGRVHSETTGSSHADITWQLWATSGKRLCSNVQSQGTIYLLACMF